MSARGSNVSGALLNILIGGGICLLGIVITVGSYAAATNSPTGGRYTVAYGAIIFGAWRFIQGMIQLASGDSSPDDHSPANLQPEREFADGSQSSASTAAATLTPPRKVFDRQVAGSTCARCQKYLLLGNDGVFSKPTQEFLCCECVAKESASQTSASDNPVTG